MAGDRNNRAQGLSNKYGSFAVTNVWCTQLLFSFDKYSLILTFNFFEFWSKNFNQIRFTAIYIYRIFFSKIRRQNEDMMAIVHSDLAAIRWGR